MTRAVPHWRIAAPRPRTAVDAANNTPARSATLCRTIVPNTSGPTSMPVESLTIERRVPYRGGATFGDVGSYEQIDGVLNYAVDPTDAANARVVDLALAPRDKDGLVRFKGNVTVLQPTDA